MWTANYLDIPVLHFGKKEISDMWGVLPNYKKWDKRRSNKNKSFNMTAINILTRGLNQLEIKLIYSIFRIVALLKLTDIIQLF